MAKTALIFKRKKHLVEEVSRRCLMPRKKVKFVIDEFLLAICAAVREGYQVALLGFGNFRVFWKAGRSTINPRTGKFQPGRIKYYVLLKPSQTMLRDWKDGQGLAPMRSRMLRVRVGQS